MERTYLVHITYIAYLVVPMCGVPKDSKGGVSIKMIPGKVRMA